MSEAYNLKFTISKPKLKKLLEFTSIDQELDTIWLKYSSDGIYQSQVDESFVIAVVSWFNNMFFTSYSASGNGELKIPSTLYKVVGKYFKELDNIEFTVKEDNIILRGRDEVYEGQLLRVELPNIGTDLINREYGYIPADLKVMGVYGIDAEEWRLKADEVKITYGDTLKLTIMLEEGGKYTRGVKILDKREIAGSGSVVVDGKILKTITEMFTGPIFLVITEGPIILTQKSSDYTVSYIIAPRATEEV